MLLLFCYSTTYKVDLNSLHSMHCVAHKPGLDCAELFEELAFLINIQSCVLKQQCCCAGVRFGPPGSKRLVYFVDDMNMPFVDKYDTQSAIELIRQSVDYRGWFDKVKIVLKEVTNTQYCACMNPTAGSFNITPRMQRHFVTFAVQMPHMDIVR